jgi:hypothetical protein
MPSFPNARLSAESRVFELGLSARNAPYDDVLGECL